MKCPKCGSPHIRAATCVMCGAIVQRLEPLAVRMCPSCGRKRRFEGMCCVDCAAAVALGAISIKNNLRRAYRDDPLQPGYCPAAEWLEQHVFRWHSKDCRYFTVLRYQYWPVEKKVLHRQRALQYKRATFASPESRAKKNKLAREYARRPDVRERAKAQKRKRYWENPEVRRKHRERCRAYYHKRRAEMQAAQALENQTEAMDGIATPDENTVCLRACAGGADATPAVA